MFTFVGCSGASRFSEAGAPEEVLEKEAELTAGMRYRIITTCGTGTKVLDIKDGSTADGASVVIATRDNSRQSQIFKIEAYGGAYILRAEHSGKVFDVQARSLSNSAPINQYTLHGGSNQLFYVESPSSGIYRFKNVNSGLYADLTARDTTDGNKIIQYESNTTCAQRFKLEAVTTAPVAEYYMQSNLSGLCMRSQSGVVEAGARVVQGACDTSALYFAQYARPSGQCLQIKGTNLCLQFVNGNTSLNGPTELAACSDDSTQLFTISTANGVSQLKNVKSGLCLEIESSSMQAGAILEQWTCGTYANSYFKLTTSPTQPGTINSLDTILNDMRLKHDMKIQNISAAGAWATGPGMVGIGRDATKVAPWGEVFIGEGNTATNSRVQIRNWTIYYQRNSDQTWHVFRQVKDPQGGFYGKDTYEYSGKSVTFRTESEGFSVERPPNNDPAISWAHFWSTSPYSSDIPDQRNIRAILVTAEFRLILDNPSGTDDRDLAKYLFRLGADDPTHQKPTYEVNRRYEAAQRALAALRLPPRP